MVWSPEFEFIIKMWNLNFREPKLVNLAQMQVQMTGVNIFPFAPRYLGAEFWNIIYLGQDFGSLNDKHFLKELKLL